MIYSLEEAKSSQSSCKKCGKNIEKGAVRGVSLKRMKKFFSKEYICAKCSRKILQELLEELDNFATKR